MSAADWKSLAQSSLISYTIAHNDQYEPSNHHLLLAYYLEQVYLGNITRLLVFMPPRHGKTELVSKNFPPWAMGKDPDMQIMLASYGQELADDLGEAVRDKMAGDVHQAVFPGSKIRSDNAAKKRFRVENGQGTFFATGIGGPATGRGFHIGVIDDPVKNQEEADSEVIQERNWNWYRTVFRTRIAKRSPKRPNGGAIVVCQTRWNMNDLSGKLLQAMKEDGEQWVVLELDAMPETEEEARRDPLGRKVGEPLWPDAFPVQDLVAVKKAIGSRAYTALFKQRPSPDEGGIVKRGWWKYYKVVPAKFDEIIESWDMAFKDVDSSSFVVGQVWGRLGAEYYLLDQVRARMDFVATCASLISLTAKWRSMSRLSAILVEAKANGPAVIAQLRKKISGMIAVEPDGSKEARAQSVAPYIEAGNVYVPDPTLAPWVHDFVEEWSAFPNGANNDQVDAGSQALHRLTAEIAQGTLNYYRDVMKEMANA